MRTVESRSRPHRGRTPRRLAAAVLCAGLLAAAGCGGGGGNDDGDVITIRYASVGATGSEIMNQSEWFAEQVEERTDGRVKFEFFLDGTLVGAAETLHAVLDGRADAGYLCDCYNTNEFPVWSLFSMPFMGNNAEAFMLTAMELYQSDTLLTREFEEVGLHPNWFHTIGAGLTYMREPISGVEDLRVSGCGRSGRPPRRSPRPARSRWRWTRERSTNRCSAARWTASAPSSSPAPTRSASMRWRPPGRPGHRLLRQRGVRDERGGLESLPADIQEVFNEVSDELMSGVAIEIYEEASQEACDAFLAEGGTVTIFPEDQVAAWRDSVLPDMLAAWEETVVAAYGVDRTEAQEFYQAYTETLAKHVAASDHVPDAEACAARQ